MASHFKFTDLKQWYNVEAKSLKELGHGGILEYYNNSLIEALKDLYPHYPFRPWSFKKAKRGFFGSQANRRLFFQELRSELGITHMDGFYDLTADQVRAFGGMNILKMYKNSLVAAVVASYPEYDWQVWRFKLVPKGFWDKSDNVLKYLDFLKSKLDIKSEEDWYGVTWKEFTENRGSHLLQKFGSVFLLLDKFYPNYKWEKHKFLNKPNGFWQDEENAKNTVLLSPFLALLLIDLLLIERVFSD